MRTKVVFVSVVGFKIITLHMRMCKGLNLGTKLILVFLNMLRV